MVARYVSRDQQRKNEEPDASHGRSSGIDTYRLPRPDRSVQADSFFSLPLVLFNQSCTRRQDCRKCEEYPSHTWPVFLRDNSSCRSCQATAAKTERGLIPLRIFERREIDLNAHPVYLSTTYHRPKAPAAQTVSNDMVTRSALYDRRIIVQHTQDA